MIKIATDVSMTILLLPLMAYVLVGQEAHEWLGIAMFVLFVLHHVLNRRWSKSILKGRYTLFRMIQTIFVVLILLTMLGSLISGVILSRYAFAFLLIRGGRSFARMLHMICAYWGFVLMSLHLGLHWNMMMEIARSHAGKSSAARTWILRVAAVLIACYGAYAFLKRDIGSYMLLQNQFVFFDFEEPRILFFLDYIAVMGLFVCMGHYLAVWMRKRK